MNKTTVATLAALAGNSIFGFSFLFSKMALDLTTPFVLLAVRFLTAFLVMNLLVLSGIMKLDLKGKPVKMLLILGLVQPVIYFICENYGIAMTSTALSGTMLALTPIAGLVLGRVFLKEPCRPFQVLCAIGSIVGVSMTTAGGVGKVSALGVALLLGAAVSAAAFNVISRSTARYFSAFERTYVMFALGSVVFTVIALVENRNNMEALKLPLTTPRFWASVLYLAVASSACAFLLINYAVNFLPAGKVAMYTNFTSVISVLAGILILKESFSAVQILGIVIIIASVFGVSYERKAKAADGSGDSDASSVTSEK